MYNYEIILDVAVLEIPKQKTKPNEKRKKFQKRINSNGKTNPIHRKIFESLMT